MEQCYFQLIAQAVISPIIGLLMDVVARASLSGKPNYLVPFCTMLFFNALTIIAVCRIKMDLKLPKGAKLKDVVQIVKNAEICVFILLMLVFGTLWGFMETFLFVYLKDDLGASMSLLGLTITTGAVVSIPFIFFADTIVDKVRLG